MHSEILGSRETSTGDAFKFVELDELVSFDRMMGWSLLDHGQQIAFTG